MARRVVATQAMVTARNATAETVMAVGFANLSFPDSQSPFHFNYTILKNQNVRLCIFHGNRGNVC